VTSRQDAERRRAELVTALGALRSRIADACDAVGRDQREVTLIAVTKNFPASDVATLATIGVLDIGENKNQEARAKIKELAGPQIGSGPIRWHMVGRLQSNKARSVVAYASAVHTVDRPKIVRALAEAASGGRDTVLDVFIQVSLDGDPDRGGAVIEQVPALAAEVAAHDELRLRGVMAVPPIDSDPRIEFARLEGVSRALRERYPAADAISAGMSDDLEAAIEFGSTHLRVGTALLGRREATFG
jgi:hypothetical protein